MKYRADVDGLRAVAILPVLSFHAGLGASGGFIGVDIFFVISGYLIAGLILKDLDLGKFSIFEFWERRIRRILPAVAVVALATLAIGALLFLPQDFRNLGQSSLYQALLAANIYFWRDSGYFAQGADVKPLLHTWSLAVEEQFYLLFPFLLMAISRFCRKWLTALILILGIASFGLSVWGTYASTVATFYLLPTRAWELLTGALLASLPPQRQARRWVAECLSYLGLAAILFAVFRYNEATRFPGAAALLPCLATVIIIWANGCSLTSLGKLLAMPPVVFIGLISYSLYLWHWPLLVYARYWSFQEVPLGYRLLILAASFVLAAASWKFVESPFRKRLLLKSRPRVFAFACTVITLLAVSGLMIYQKQGLPGRFSRQALQYADGAADRPLLVSLSVDQARKGNFIELGGGDTKRPIHLVVWGDSHAMAVMPVIDALCNDYGVRGIVATHSATAPLVGYASHEKYSLGGDSIAFNDAVLAFIRKNHVSDVILAARWTSYDDGSDEIRDHLAVTAGKLKEIGVRTWILRAVPLQPWRNAPKALAAAAIFGGNPEEMGQPLSRHKARTQREGQIMDAIAQADVTILDPTRSFLNSKGICRAAAGGYSLYFDQHHLTNRGAMLLRPLFEPIFRRVAQGP